MVLMSFCCWLFSNFSKFSTLLKFLFLTLNMCLAVAQAKPALSKLFFLIFKVFKFSYGSWLILSYTQKYSVNMLNTLTKKIVQKLYKMHSYIQKLYKTLNLYIFCIQRLCKSKFCMIMNIQKVYIKFLHIYKKFTNCTKVVHGSD